MLQWQALATCLTVPGLAALLQMPLLRHQLAQEDAWGPDTFCACLAVKG